jgi:hypothetical protein
MNDHENASDPTAPTVQIDEGLYEWYESCPCCMSKANPEVKQALDTEKAATAAP